MKIQAPCVVALTWTLKDTSGEVLDELSEPVAFFLGGHDLLPAMEQALQTHQAGDKLELQIEPEQAFGDYNENLVFIEARTFFPAELEAGMVFDGLALPAGCDPSIPTEWMYTVTDVYPEHVVLDGNHPLAGMAIRLDLHIASVRAATAEELKKRSLGTGFFQWIPPDPAAPLDADHPILH